MYYYQALSKQTMKKRFAQNKQFENLKEKKIISGKSERSESFSIVAKITNKTHQACLFLFLTYLFYVIYFIITFDL